MSKTDRKEINGKREIKVMENEINGKGNKWKTRDQMEINGKGEIKVIRLIGRVLRLPWIQ